MVQRQRLINLPRSLAYGSSELMCEVEICQKIEI